MPGMIILMTHHTGRRLAELGLLFVLFAGIWSAAAEMPQFTFAYGALDRRRDRARGRGPAATIAIHWGKFG